VTLAVERERARTQTEGLAEPGEGKAAPREASLQLRRQLAYKSEWYASTLVIADRFYPSSRLCSGCGVIKDTLALGERVFDCDACGVSLDRDENAAINLRRLGLGGLPPTRRSTSKGVLVRV
jgi:putative transposase